MRTFIFKLLILPIFLIAYNNTHALEITGSGVASADNYTAWVAGVGFTSAAYIDVRAPGSSTIIGNYVGAARSYTTHNGIQVITFRVTDATQRSLLNAGGLNFYVVNPSPSGFAGPALVKRTVASVPSLTISGGGLGEVDMLSAYIVGTSFTSASYVDVRASTATAVIGNYAGAARTYDNVNGADILTFRVKDSIQESLMTHGGLYSWVVNPTLSVFTGPQTFHRSNKEQAFGGSNYDWYHVDVSGTTCNREPYGIIKNYNLTAVQSQVATQLAGMYSEGQRRLRIAIFFAPDVGTGTVIQTPGGVVPAQYLANLTNFLTAVKNAGFQEVIVGLFPQSSYTLWTDTTYSSTKADQYWNVIQQARQAIVNANIPYLFDLGNELMPPVGASSVWASYITTLWGHYVSTYGVNYTVGFSTPSADRISNMGIYGASKPAVVDVHIYDANAAAAYAAADSSLASQGLANTDIVIGETWYNDATYATSLRNAVNASTSGRWMRWLAGWPIKRTAPLTCSDGLVPPPLSDANFLLDGF